MDPKAQPPGLPGVRSNSPKLPSGTDVLLEKLKLLFQNKTARFFLAYGVIMLFLVSGIAIKSMTVTKAADPAPTPYITGRQAIIQPPTSTPAPTRVPATPTPTLPPVIEWVTYTNIRYGYAIQHPPSWKATDLGELEPQVPNFVTIDPDNVASASVTLSVTVSSSTRTYDEVIALKSENRQPLTVGSLTGIRTNERNSDGVESIHAVIRGRLYVYVFVAQKKYERVFDRMIQTFREL